MRRPPRWSRYRPRLILLRPRRPRRLKPHRQLLLRHRHRRQRLKLHRPRQLQPHRPRRLQLPNPQRQRPRKLRQKRPRRRPTNRHAAPAGGVTAAATMNISMPDARPSASSWPPAGRRWRTIAAPGAGGTILPPRTAASGPVPTRISCGSTAGTAAGPPLVGMNSSGSLSTAIVPDPGVRSEARVSTPIAGNRTGPCHAGPCYCPAVSARTSAYRPARAGQSTGVDTGAAGSSPRRCCSASSASRSARTPASRSASSG